MRIMIDTNVLISIAIFKSEVVNKFLEKLEDHTVILSSTVLDEAREVIGRKFPHYSIGFEIFLSKRIWEYQYAPHSIPNNLYEIRDKTDAKILHAAYSANVDYLITGDKDFFEREYEGLCILTMSQFIEFKFKENVCE